MRGGSPGDVFCLLFLSFVGAHSQSTLASDDLNSTVSKRSPTNIDTVSEVIVTTEGSHTERNAQSIPTFSENTSTTVTSIERTSENNEEVQNNETEQFGARRGGGGWNPAAPRYGTGYNAGAAPISSVQTQADATVQLLSTGRDPYGSAFNNLQNSLGAAKPDLGSILSKLQSVVNTAAATGGHFSGSLRTSRIIPRNELIYLDNYPGAENLIRCTQEAEFHHVAISRSQCLVCACMRMGALLRPTCATCAGCGLAAPAQHYAHRPTDHYLPQLHLQKPDTWPTNQRPYPGSVPEVPGQVSEYQRPISEYPGQIPGYPGGLPQYPGQAPKYPEHVPGGLGAVPEYPGQAPKYPQHLSGYPAQVPGYHGASPQYPGQVPEYPGQVPGYPGQIPNYPGQVPGYPGASPEYPVQVQEYPPQVPEYPGQVPGYPGPLPENQGQVPGYPMTSPEYQGKVPVYPGQIQGQTPGYPLPNPARTACSPLPAGVPFEHPLNPCQICICDGSLVSTNDTSIACLENPQCVTPVDIPQIPSAPYYSTPVSTPLCQLFPRNIIFPHPSEKCKQCKCIEEVSLIGNPELKILCVPDIECGIESILPILPSLLPSDTYNPQTQGFYPDNIAEPLKKLMHPNILPKLKHLLPKLTNLPNTPGSIPPALINEIASALATDLPNNNLQPSLLTPQEPFAPMYTNMIEPSPSPLPRPIQSLPTGLEEQEPLLVPYEGPTPPSTSLGSPQSPSILGPQAPGASPRPPAVVPGTLPWPPVTDMNQENRGPLLGPPPHESCRPYPTNTMFQHPWSECQMCQCSEFHSTGHVSIEVDCYTKPDCCIVVPSSSNSVGGRALQASAISAQPGQLQLLDNICEFKTFGVEFVHPADACRVCRCQQSGPYVAPACTRVRTQRCQASGGAISSGSSSASLGAGSDPDANLYGYTGMSGRNELYNTNQQNYNNMLQPQPNSFNAVAQANVGAGVVLDDQNVQQNLIQNTYQNRNRYRPPQYGFRREQDISTVQPDGAYSASYSQFYTTDMVPYLNPTTQRIDSFVYPSYAPTSARADAAAYKRRLNSYPPTRPSPYAGYAAGQRATDTRHPPWTTAHPAARERWDTTTSIYSQADSNTEAWARARAAAPGAKFTRSGDDNDETR